MLEEELSELQSSLAKASETGKGVRKWDSLISRYYKTKELTPDMLKALVKEIKLYADGSISIDFKYMDEFEEMMKECRRIRGEVA